MVGDFYGTGIEIWAGFDPLAVLKKGFWADYEQLLRVVFSCLQGQKDFFFKHWSARTKKLHKMNLKKKLVITLRTKLFYTTFITTPESML